LDGRTKRMRRAGNEAHMEEKRKTCRILVRNLDGKEHFEDQGVDGNNKSGSKGGKA